MTTIARAMDCGILRLTLNRPERLNAISALMLDDLSDIVATAQREPPDFITMTGAGPRAFSAGADLHEVSALGPEDCNARNDRARDLFDAFARLPCPSLAIINGIAFGGGLELALACTFRIAHGTARLALPEIRLGVMPTYGGTQRLPALIGRPAALRMLLSGESIDALQALRLGLVDQCYDEDGLLAGDAFLAPMRPHPVPARRAILAAVADGPGGLDREAVLARDIIGAPGALEAIRHFAGK